MAVGTTEMKTTTGRGASRGIAAAAWKLGAGNNARQTYSGSVLRKPLACSQTWAAAKVRAWRWRGASTVRRLRIGTAPEMARATAQSSGLDPGTGVGWDWVAAQQQQQQRTRWARALIDSDGVRGQQKTSSSVDAKADLQTQRANTRFKC